MIVTGYRVESLRGGGQRVTAYFDEGGTEYVSVVDIASCRPHDVPPKFAQEPFKGGERQCPDFVSVLVALERWNDPNARADIWRELQPIATLTRVCPCEISQEAHSATWTAKLENPVDGTATYHPVYPDNQFWGEVQVDCVLENTVDAQVGRSTLSTQGGVAGYMEYTLVAGDDAREISVYDGSSTHVLDISPAGHSTGCSCQNCQAVVAANLTYNGANGDDFAVAVRQAIINALCSDHSAVFGINYWVDVEHNAGKLRIRFMNKAEPVDTLYYIFSSGGLTQEGLTRAAVPVTPDVYAGFVFYRELGLFDTQLFDWPCAYDVPCATLTNAQTTGLAGTGSTRHGALLGNPLLIGGVINGGAAATACSNAVKLTAVIGVECFDSGVDFLWSTGETTPEIHVNAGAGAVWVTVTCGNGCTFVGSTFVE